MHSAVPSAGNRAPSLSKPAEIVLRLMLALAGPVIMLGMLEGLAYLWERNQANSLYAWELVASRRMEWVQYPTPGAGYTLMAPGRLYEWQGIPVSINSHGLRGPETTVEKPPATFRLLNLGDSVAMGWGVREEDTYGRRLQVWANGHAQGELHYEVINAAVPGWNLDNAFAYLQAEGLAYEPDVIILDVTLVNDIRGQSALVADERPAIVNWLRSHTYFWPFLTIQMRWLEARAQGKDRIDVINPPTEAASYFPLQREAAEWTRVWGTVSDITQLAHENGAQVVLVLFPLEFQVLNTTFSTLPQEVFVSRALEAGLDVVDLLPAFRQACQEKPGGTCQREDRYLFADVWMHPSAFGHQITAAELEPVLVRMLPQ